MIIVKNVLEGSILLKGEAQIVQHVRMVIIPILKDKLHARNASGLVNRQNLMDRHAPPILD